MLKGYRLSLLAGLLLSGMVGIEASWAKTQTLPGEILAKKMVVSPFPILEGGGDRQFPLKSLKQPQWVAQNPQFEEADRLFKEGLELLGQGTAESLQEAIAKLEAAIPLYQSGGSYFNEATTKVALGRVHDRLGFKSEALAYNEEALIIFQALSQQVTGETLQVVQDWHATTLNNIGKVYDDLGEKQKALDYYQQALPLSQSIGDRNGEAVTISNIGKVYDDLGEKQKALDYYQQALPLYQAIGDREGEGTVLNNMGKVYDDLGEKQEALNYFQQSLSIARDVGNLTGEARTLSNIGLLYNALGDKQEALNYYQQALPISRSVGDRNGEANILNNMGTIYADLGDKQEALNYYQQALPLRRTVGDRDGEAATLNNIGLVYDLLGERQEALNYYQQALDFFQAVGNRAGETVTLNNMGRVYRALGEKEKALNYYQQALPLSRAIGDRSKEAGTLYHIALTQRAQNDLENAIVQMEKSIAILEDLRTKAPTTELRQTYFSSVQDYYTFYIDLLMELHQQNPDRGYDVRAFQASESSRGRTLTEILTEAQFNLKADLPPHLIAEEKRLNQELSNIEKQRVNLLQNRSGYSNSDLERITEKSDRIFKDLQTLEAKIRRENPAYANLKYPQPLTLEKIQQEILDENTLLLEYALGGEQSHLFVVSKTTFTAYTLPSRSEIETATAQYINALQAENRNPLSEGKELSQMLLGPIADKLKNQRLAIVADGKLNRLPFAALPWKSQEGAREAREEGASIAPLLANHEIINLSSASSLDAQRSQWEKRSPAPKQIAVLADPIFSPRDPRISGNSPPSAENAQNEMLSLLRSGCQSFDRLPNTKIEAENILELVPDDQEFLALGFAANRTQALDGSLSQYRMLHFSTHGCIQDDPLRSGLVFSLYDEKGDAQDGLLRLQDIYNLNLNADLVVLSACQTGIGEEVNGEGVVGLTRGFMYAGAKRVVVSLWNVNDAATANLMTDYYKKMLQEDLDAIAALREAQLQMWKNGEFPYKWAAFTIQGDWQ